MSLSDVQTALFTAAVDSLGDIPIEGENTPFQRPTNSVWAVLSFVPNTPVVETLGSVGQDRVDGFIQIDLRYPDASGDSAARDDFETIRAAFKAGSRFTYNGQQVTILNCGRSQGRATGSWYRISVTITWYALIPR
jgi:hypothetical protein